MPSTVVSLPHWIPFRLACRLHSLKNIYSGNTTQNIASFLAAAITEAATGTAQNGTWARWRVGFNSRTSSAGLLICPRLVPGYTAPAGTNYANVPLILPPTITAANDVGNDARGYAATALVSYWGFSGAFGSIANGTLNGDAITGLFWYPAGGYLVFCIGATVAQNFFTSLTYTGNSGLVTLTTAAAAAFSTSQPSGQSKWVWESPPASDPFTAGNLYPLTFV
jgi:hypothetical protein